MSIRLMLTVTVLAALGAAASGQQAALAQAAPVQPASTRRDTVVERGITELHTRLKITAAEETPFTTFAQAMRDNAQRMDAAVGVKRAGAQTATAVDQMKAYAAVAQAHSEEVNGLVGPFTSLYDALSPQQRKVADQSFRDFSSQAQAGRPARG